MNRLIFWLTITLAAIDSGNAQVPALSNEQRKILVEGTNTRGFHSTTNLPAQVVALCEAGPNGLAEPGQPWEAGDVITNPKLPRKRLIWAAAVGDYYVVHYESGGRAHSYKVILAHYETNDASALLLWDESRGFFKDYKAFLDYIKAMKLPPDSSAIGI